MKKILFIIVLILPGLSYGQITTLKVNTKAPPPQVYDSLQNFLGSNVQLYQGQDLYLNGVTEGLRQYGYEGFVKDYRMDNFQYPHNIYKGGKEGDHDQFNSKYNEIVGKYFKVLRIINPSDKIAARRTIYFDSILVVQDSLFLDSIAKPKKISKKIIREELRFIKDSLKQINEQAIKVIADNNIINRNEFFLELQEKQSGDIVYYKYDAEYELQFPFIVVGYFTKLKQRYIGKEYVISISDSNAKTMYISGHVIPISEINNGNPVSNFKAGTRWKCIDVTVLEKYFVLAVILQNEKGEQIAESIDFIDKNCAYEISQAKEYEAKFGTGNWNSILRKKVKLGMTKDMCKLSWGQPEAINETVTSSGKSEQWVYPDNYLYFDQDILTALQSK